MAGNIYFAPSNPSLGANLGNALGQGLLGGIQSILDLRMKKLQQQEAAKAFKDLGFTEAEAQGISKLDPALQQVYLRQKKTTLPTADQSGLAALQKLGVDPALAQFGPSVLGAAIKEKLKPNPASGIRAIVPGISDEEAQVIGNLPPSLQAAYYRYITQSGLIRQPGEEGLGLLQQEPLVSPMEVPGIEQLIPGTQENGLQALAAMQTAPTGMEALQQMMPHRAQEELLQEEAQAVSQVPTTAKDIAKERVPVTKVPVQTPVSEGKKKTLAEQAQEARAKKAAAEEQKKQDTEAKKIQDEIDKETKPYYDELISANKAAQENDIRLNRMDQLIHRKNLNSPGVYSALNVLANIPYVGISFKDLLTADTQEFEKLSTDFLKNAKAYFGARITEKEVLEFLKTVPTLLQSHKGKRRVIENLRGFNDAVHAKADALKEIIKENNGKRPANLQQLVEDRASGKLDLIRKKMALGYGDYQLGLNDTKLPNPSAHVVGALLKRGGTQYVNILNPDTGKQYWQPLVNAK